MTTFNRSGRRKLASNTKPEAFVGTVRDMASDGRGVVRAPSGKVFLVSGVWLDETIEIEPTGSKGSIGFGVVKRLIEASAERREPSCGHHGFSSAQCGGCPWQFMSYVAQLKAKQGRVEAHCAKLELEDAALKPILAAPSEWQYRNRAQFKTDGAKLGYVASGSNTLVDVKECPVLTPVNQSSLGSLRRHLPNKEWRPSKSNLWRTLNIDDTESGVSVDARLPFRQGNTDQNHNLRQWIREQISALPRDWAALELFAGSGNFTTVLAEHFTHVTAVEGDESSVGELASLKLSNVTAACYNLFNETAMDLLCKTYKKSQVLVVDPPRDGLKVRAPLLRRLRALEAVIYISCDLATWQRDCLDWHKAGFTLRSVQGIDLFPQTPHVEVMSVLARR